jgi:hypothetical protein
MFNAGRSWGTLVLPDAAYLMRLPSSTPARFTPRRKLSRDSYPEGREGPSGQPFSRNPIFCGRPEGFFVFKRFCGRAKRTGEVIY